MIINNIKGVVLLILVIFVTACASGSYIITGKVRAPINFKLVQLYIDAPENYETIGLVKSSSDAGWTEQGSQDYAVQELKKQAAKIGANGVLLITTGENTSAFISTNPNGGSYAIPVSAQTLTGKAIYVSK
tara:strand:- start:2715 stop:3107 length:393 start_codon:yes stop_codon:yes gene_type:complete